MFNVRRITSIGIICISAIIILWDIFAYKSAANSSVSVVMTDWSRYHPTVAFIAGVLMGHWFFPARGTEDP